MKCKASYHSILGPDGLQSVGVMAVGGPQLAYVARPGLEGHQALMMERLNRSTQSDFTPIEVFQYLVDGANGISVDWSIPVDVEADDAEAAAMKLVSAIDS